MAQSPLLKRLRKRAKDAVGEILAAESRAGAVGAAVRKVQEGRRAIDDNASRVVGALGLATEADVERVAQKIGKLRKRLVKVLERL